MGKDLLYTARTYLFLLWKFLQHRLTRQIISQTFQFAYDCDVIGAVLIMQGLVLVFEPFLL